MSNEEKLRLIESVMEMKGGTLKETDLLENYDEWDSLAALSFVAMVDKKFKKALNGKALKEAKTVKELMDLI